MPRQLRGRIRRDPCDECHERSEPALWAPLQLLPPASYKSPSLLISKLSVWPKAVTVFWDAATHLRTDRNLRFSRSWGLRGFQIFKQIGFSQLFLYTLISERTDITAFSWPCLAGPPLPSLKVASAPAYKKLLFSWEERFTCLFRPSDDNGGDRVPTKSAITMNLKLQLPRIGQMVEIRLNCPGKYLNGNFPFPPPLPSDPVTP